MKTFVRMALLMALVWVVAGCQPKQEFEYESKNGEVPAEETTEGGESATEEVAGPVPTVPETIAPVEGRPEVGRYSMVLNESDKAADAFLRESGLTPGALALLEDGTFVWEFYGRTYAGTYSLDGSTLTMQPQTVDGRAPRESERFPKPVSFDPSSQTVKLDDLTYERQG